MRRGEAMRSEIFKYRWPLLGIAALLASSAGAATIAWNAQQHRRPSQSRWRAAIRDGHPILYGATVVPAVTQFPAFRGGWPGGRAAGGYQTPGLRRGRAPQFAGKSDPLDCGAANVFTALGYARYRNLEAEGRDVATYLYSR